MWGSCPNMCVPVSSQGEGEQPALCSALQEWHTRVVRDSCSPLFGEQFSCALLRQHDLPRVTLRMEVGAQRRPPGPESAGFELNRHFVTINCSLNAHTPWVNSSRELFSINGLVRFCSSDNSSRLIAKSVHSAGLTIEMCDSCTITQSKWKN